MDDGSHVFLIKDKIRCIQKKIMDQLAADLNSALNDTDVLTSSQSNPLLASSSFTILSKIKRRRKRPVNNEMSQPKSEPSGSTTPENTRSRTNNYKQSIVSDSDEVAMPSKTQSSLLAAASESDSASQTDEIRRYRRPFKKPIIPSTLKTEQTIRLTRCPSMKVSDAPTITIGTPLRRRRRNCRSEGSSRILDIDENPATLSSSSSSFSLAINKTSYIGKRKRSRAIIHEDFRLRNNSLHDYDMTSIDDTNITNFSSSSSLNLSDSDKDPCVTSNEADDEQSDWPRDESSVPRLNSWWEDDDDDDDEKSDNDEKMLTTTDGTLQKIVNGALTMMLARSKNTLENRIKTFVHREMLTGNRRNIDSKNTYTHPHPKRHVRLFKEARRSHHNSYSHKRVKSDHYSPKHNDLVTPIDSSNMTSQSLEKIDCTASNPPPVNQPSLLATVQTHDRNSQPGSAYENTPMDTSEQASSSSNHPSHLPL